MGFYLLAIDQGTTNSRAILFNQNAQMLGHHDETLQQFYPQTGWVEQDPDEMFNNTLFCCQKVIANAGIAASEIAGIGITNQRETTIIWDKTTGKSVYRAIVWQDRRTSDLCCQISLSPIASSIQDKTGLLIDPYFSACKIMWILEHVPGVRERALRGELLFGTVETYLLWRLTAGKSHFTDVTNASRTMLFNIHEQTWDQEILAALDIPPILLPEVLPNTANFGVTAKDYFGLAIPITGMAGDQQAATIGQACFEPGMVKVTYGTGCFMLLNTGPRVIKSHNRLLATIAYRINDITAYGLEGSIFSAGNIVKWLRDSLHIINSSAETAGLADQVIDTGGVYLVPAFTGLGAPYWDPLARGALLGLALDTRIPHIVRAALESVCYQTRDLLGAMINDSGRTIESLRVDGGMVANNWLLQFLADMLGIGVHRPTFIETTALGAAYLAGLQIGMFQSLDKISQLWQQEAQFEPKLSKEKADLLYSGWKAAVQRIRCNVKHNLCK